MKDQTAKEVVMGGLPPAQREALLNWASDHRVDDTDPVWALAAQGSLQHDWLIESVRELEAAQRAATARIHQTSLAATRALSQAAQVSRREVAEGLGDEVRELLATETRRALTQASRGTWVHKTLHWAAPLLLGLAVAAGTAAWVTSNQPSQEDQRLGQALKKAWPRLPGAAQQVIREALK